MKYLSLLKSENIRQEELPKLPEPPFDSFGSEGGRHFSKNDTADPAPFAVDVKINTGTRTVRVIESHAPAALPGGCPLLGGPVPPECRFETKLFKRMIRQGILPIGGPCPLRLVCGREV